MRAHRSTHTRRASHQAIHPGNLRRAQTWLLGVSGTDREGRRRQASRRETLRRACPQAACAKQPGREHRGQPAWDAGEMFGPNGSMQLPAFQQVAGTQGPPHDPVRLPCDAPHPCFAASSKSVEDWAHLVPRRALQARVTTCGGFLRRWGSRINRDRSPRRRKRATRTPPQSRIGSYHQRARRSTRLCMWRR